MIGILGGMGPLASANFYKILIDVVTDEYGVKENHEFPRLLLDNIPVHFPDFDPSTGTSPGIELTIEMIEGEIDRLSRAGANIFGMPCNTFHLYIHTLREYLGERGRFVGMVEETANRVKNAGYKNIGILGTETTIELGLYDREFSSEYVIYKLDRAGRKRTVESIMNVISGKISQSDIEFMEQSIITLRGMGAECVILGCTELPLIAEKINSPIIPLYNPMRILAEELSRNYFRKNAI